MRRCRGLVSTGILSVLCIGPGASAQQAGTAEIAAQMMRIVEMRLDRAGVRVSAQGRELVWEFVAHAADEAYAHKDLAGVVPRAESLADRLVESARKQAWAVTKVEVEAVLAGRCDSSATACAGACAGPPAARPKSEPRP